MTTSIPIVKTNGTGNDFVLVDERETPLERNLNIAFSLLLVATVVGLWIYFR